MVSRVAVPVLVLVLGLLQRSSCSACSSDDTCTDGRFCNFDDGSSGYCEDCHSCGPPDETMCYSCGINEVAGMHDCAARCPNYVARCDSYCSDPCDTFSCPPAECAGCSEVCAGEECGSGPGAQCNPAAADWHDDCPQGSGFDPGFIIPLVLNVLFFGTIGFAVKAHLDRRRENKRRAANPSQGMAQPGTQMAQGRVPMPMAQAQAMPMTMQITLPPGATPGQSIQVNANGQVLAVVVPPGAQPGAQITIQVPAAQQAVSAVPMQQAVAVPMTAGATVQQGIALD